MTIFFSGISIIGATGLVGRKVLEVLLERGFLKDQVSLFASKRSAGTVVSTNGYDFLVEELSEFSIKSNDCDIAIFSAGSVVSEEFAPLFVERGIRVIDNSSFWRMNPNVPLIIPEVNGEEISKHQGIIANPNCSTIQMLMVLKPLHDLYTVKRVVVSTYQSVSGAGKKGTEQLESEIAAEACPDPVFPHQISMNAIPHIDVFQESGYSKEEWKMIVETKKILDDSIEVAPTCARIPTAGGHSESLTIEFENQFDIDEVKEALENFPGLKVQDDLENNIYPMPIHAHEKDEVFVGRIRRDPTVKSGLHLWVVADNIRKGAATNAVQIAELLLKQK